MTFLFTMRRNYQLLVWCLAVFLIKTANGGEFNCTGKVVGNKTELELIKTLLDPKVYDPRVRPVKRHTDTLDVSFDIILQQIIELDEKDQLLKTSMYMDWVWKDEYLTWDPCEYGGLDEIRLFSDDAWVPDIIVYNSAVDGFDQMLHVKLMVNYDGFVSWYAPGVFMSTCDLDVTYFPLDKQKCKIKFGVWTYTGNLVDMVIKKDPSDTLPKDEIVKESSEVVSAGYHENGAWDLTKITGKRSGLTYDCCPGQIFVDITYTFHLQRRRLFYGFNLILPCVFINALTMLVFLLPADAGERISLGITILLTMVVFLQLLGENLPPSDNTPLLGNYFACSIIMIALTVIVCVVSLKLHHTDKDDVQEMPSWMRSIFLGYLPKLFRMNPPEERSVLSKQNGNFQRYEQETEDKGLDLIGSKDRYSPSGSMENILKELRFITDRMLQDDEDERFAHEWRFIATVLDKIMLYFLITFFVLSTTLTFCLIPGVFLPLEK